ncbi:MAG: phage capsid protein [Verrucomicrobiota bacterium JB024]|nr:phage capsid protein [Verrucomicrobiota bacterium JB024]
MAGTPGPVTQAFIEEFSANLNYEPNQRKPRIVPFLRQDTMTMGSPKWVDVISSEEAEEKVGRMPLAPFHEMDIFRKRAIHARTGQKFHYYDHTDRYNMNYDQDAPIYAEQNAALARKMDRFVIDALENPAEERVTTTGTPVTTSVNYDNTNQAIDVGIGHASNNTGLNLLKLIRAKSIFGINDVEEDMYGKRILLVSQVQLDDLYEEIKAVGNAGDIMAFDKIYDADGIGGFRGFQIVRSQQLTISSNVRNCFMFYGDALTWCTQESTQVEIFPDPTRVDTTRIRTFFRGGAARIQDKLVVKIPCDESYDYAGTAKP